ncbi:MAG: hypothetical protein ACFFEF_11245 [Candidatus Thorarchaeota archaeon]
MKKHAVISKALLVLLLFLLVSSAINVNAHTLSDDDGDDDDDDTTTEDENEDDEHEPEHERDVDGTVWIQTQIMTVMLSPSTPSYQYWYTADENGSLARFQVSYLMVVEFEDYNGDGVYQINETIQFAPLDAFDWNLQTGSVRDGSGRNIEVYASYVKGGLTGEDWDDDWFEDWMPGYDDSDNGGLVLADGDDDDNSTDDGDDDFEDQPILNLSAFEAMTMQFYAHIYMNDYNGIVEDDEGIQANYTISGGVELKIDIELGNFPYLSDTSKVAVLNYLREDIAFSGENYFFETHEDDDEVEIESEVEWEIEDDLGEKFHDNDEDDDGQDDALQELALVEGSTNITRGFYRWLDKAVQTLPNGSQKAVDVEASYWADGNALLLFLAYPNFDGGSLLHDPSLKLEENASPVVTPTGVLGIPTEILAGAILGTVVLALIVVAIRRR